MDDPVWTAAEARERASFVLGVAPDSSSEDARAGYREQLSRYPGDSEHERVARRTLMAAWAVWCGSTPDLTVVTDGRVVATSPPATAASGRDRLARRDRGRHGVRRGGVGAGRPSRRVPGSVEVVEVVRERPGTSGVDRSPQRRLRVAPAADGRGRRTVYLDRDDRRPSVTDVRL